MTLTHRMGGCLYRTAARLRLSGRAGEVADIVMPASEIRQIRRLKWMLAVGAAGYVLLAGLVVLRGVSGWLLVPPTVAGASAAACAVVALHRHRRMLTARPRYGSVKRADGTLFPLVFHPSAENPLMFIGRRAGSEEPVPFDHFQQHTLHIDAIGPGQTVVVQWQATPQPPGTS